MKIFNYLQEYKREKPVNQQDKLIQTHYPQTEHSPKSQQKRYFISHDKVRIIYFQASVLVRALPSLTPMLKNKLFRLYRMIQSTFIAGFWGNAQLAGNASGIIYIVDL